MKSIDLVEGGVVKNLPASPRHRVTASAFLPVSASAFLPVSASAFLPATILSIAVGVCCYLAAGVSLGLFIGPLLLITFIAPPLASGETTLLGRLLACAGMTMGIWLVWIFTANLSVLDNVRCGLVLGAYVFALAGGVSLLESIRTGKTFAASAIVLFGAAWLTWPIWICRLLPDGIHSQMIVNWLTPGHPISAMNGIFFRRFDTWDHAPLAYQQLTTMNQDVTYALPHTVAWMVTGHCLAGAIGLVIYQLSRRAKTAYH